LLHKPGPRQIRSQKKLLSSQSRVDANPIGNAGSVDSARFVVITIIMLFITKKVIAAFG